MGVGVEYHWRFGRDTNECGNCGATMLLHSAGSITPGNMYSEYQKKDPSRFALIHIWLEVLDPHSDVASGQCPKIKNPSYHGTPWSFCELLKALSSVP